MEQQKQARKARPRKSRAKGTLTGTDEKEQGAQQRGRTLRISEDRRRTAFVTSRANQHEGRETQEQDLRARKARVLQQAAQQGAVAAPVAGRAGARMYRDAPAAIADPLARPPRRLGQAVPHLLQGKASRPVTNLKSLRHSRPQADEAVEEEHAAADASAVVHEEAAESVADRHGGGGNSADMAATKAAPSETKHVQQTIRPSAAQDGELLAELPSDLPPGEERMKQLRRLLQLRFCRAVDIDVSALPEQLHAKVDELVQRLTEGEPAAAGHADVPGITGAPSMALSSPADKDGLQLDEFAVSQEFAGSPVEEDEEEPAEGCFANDLGFADALEEEGDQELAQEASDMDTAVEEDDAALAGSMGELWDWDEDTSSPGIPINALPMRGSMPATRSSPKLHAWLAQDLGSGEEDEVSLPDMGSDLSPQCSDLGDAEEKFDENEGMARGSPHTTDLLDIGADMQSVDGCQTLSQGHHEQQVGLDAGTCRDEPADPVQEFTHWCDSLQVWGTATL